MCNCPNDHDLYRFIDELIDQGRWGITGVGFGERGGSRWLYSVGLSERFGHPELIAVGACCASCAGGIVNALGDRIAAGERWPIPTVEPIDVRGALVHLRPAPIECWSSDWFNVWRSYYASKAYEPPPMVAVQAIVADMDGRFPWEPGCDPSMAAAQQLPGAPVAPTLRGRKQRRDVRHRR